MKKSNILFKDTVQLLKLVKTNKFPLDVEKHGFGYNSPPFVFCSDHEKRIVDIAIENELVSGLDTNTQQDIPIIIATSPSLTPKGEEYLKNNSFFNKYPLIEKLLLVVLTGIVSAITTLLVSRFTN